MKKGTVSREEMDALAKAIQDWADRCGASYIKSYAAITEIQSAFELYFHNNGVSFGEIEREVNDGVKIH